MWSRNFLWMSISYFAGAAGAGFIVSSLGTARFWAFLVCIPIIIIVYFSYDRYMREVKASARHAEEAERARAESEHERAEQAERHVQELNNYIAEQERISRVLEETKEHFRHAAFHDSLTGLPNRAMFTELLKAEIESSKRRNDHMFAVLFLDLDRFKNINDSLGHTHGDLLLVAFAERLERTLRPIDTLARFGGDEFAILLSGMSDATDAVRVAQRIHDELTQPFVLDKNSAFATASIGIALSSSGYDDRKTFCAMLTLRCIAPKKTARPVTKFSITACTRAQFRVCNWKAICARRSNRRSSVFTTSRSFRCKPDVSRASKRSCAGTIRDVVWFRRLISFPWLKRLV